jgi:hypothetical protein
LAGIDAELEFESMKNNTRINVLVILCIFVFLLGIYLFRRPGSLERTYIGSNDTQIITSSTSRVHRLGQGENSVRGVTNISQAERSIALDTAAREQNAAVNFIGKVYDQNSNAVPDVEVVFRIAHVDGVDADSLPKVSYSQKTVVSDASGSVHLENLEGVSISFLSIKKQGYDLSPDLRHSFAPAVGTIENPVIIPMWKRGPSAELIKFHNNTSIPYDGTAVAFDLTTGQKVLGTKQGDLVVSLDRQPHDLPWGNRDTFDWHANITAPDGGVIESNGLFLYEAPESGYLPQVQIDMPANATNWTQNYKTSMFVKSRSGTMFSRVRLEFQVGSKTGKTAFSISGASNVSGRNLQP